MSAAEKIYAALFPDRYDETGKITKKIADIIAAEIAIEAKERDERVNTLESSIACTTDLLNTWARESGVAESHDTTRSELALRELVDRIWSRVSEVNHQRVQAAYAYQEEKVRELVRVCRVLLDNLGCNYEAELEEALKPFAAATAQGE